MICREGGRAQTNDYLKNEWHAFCQLVEMYGVYVRCCVKAEPDKTEIGEGKSGFESGTAGTAVKARRGDIS